MSAALKVDMKQFYKTLDKSPKQIRYASAIALTKTLKLAQYAMQSDMSKVFDRPTEFTKRKGQYVQAAKPNNLTAFLGFQRRQSSYLGKESEGGARKNTAYEKALQRAGLMPIGYVAVPARGAPVDAFGGVPKAFIMTMIRQLVASGHGGPSQRGKNRGVAGSMKKNGVYFVVKPGNVAKLTYGIWRRSANLEHRWADPVFLFVRKAEYKGVLKLEKYGRKAIDMHLQREFTQELSRAIPLRAKP